MNLSRNEIIWEYIKRLIGTPYSWGGDNPERGFDCSGFVIELLKATGEVPNSYDNTASGLNRELKANKGKKPTHIPKFGDLAFFGSGGKITHIAFCLSNTLVVEAGGGGSKTITRDDAARQGGFIRIRPLHYRKDLTEILSM